MASVHQKQPVPKVAVSVFRTLALDVERSLITLLGFSFWAQENKVKVIKPPNHTNTEDMIPVPL
jgi:hypothetical protein